MLEGTAAQYVDVRLQLCVPDTQGEYVGSAVGLVVGLIEVGNQDGMLVVGNRVGAADGEEVEMHVVQLVGMCIYPSRHSQVYDAPWDGIIEQYVVIRSQLWVPVAHG